MEATNATEQETTAETGYRYFALGEVNGEPVNRFEVNVQERDAPIVVTGPTAIPETDYSALYALEHVASGAIVEIDEAAYNAGTDYSKLTVSELDDRFGSLDGYPASGNKDAKVAFANQTSGGTA